MVHSPASSEMSDDVGHEPENNHRAGLNLGSERKLILCFDGTGGTFGDANTNVVKLASYLKKDDYTSQMVYYQTGIGTHIKTELWDLFNDGDVWSRFKQYCSYAVGWDIRRHIMGGYTFLMQNWKPGDRIYLFGFSRGAYIARALAGMLYKVGLLPRGNEEHVLAAYRMYLHGKKDTSKEFKASFCSDVIIDFVGVWDTVESVGLMHNWRFPHTLKGSHIRLFRHALALDERRVKFMQQHYEHKKARTASEDSSDLPSQDDEDRNKPPPVLEVWFAGTHGQVGGGSHKNDEPYDAARIPLVWMLREVVLTGTDIQFDHDRLEKAGISLSTLIDDCMKDDGSTTGAKASKNDEHVKNLYDHYDGDVEVPISDQLWKMPLWWFLEFLPISQSSHWSPFGRDRWKPWKIFDHSHFPNLGSPREFPKGKIHVHTSVRDRMKRTDYQPKAKWEGKPTWVA